MKKLMIAFAIVCAAVIAQAATVSWGSGKLYTVASAEGGFSSTAARATVSAYLFTLTADQYNSFLASYNNDGNMSAVYAAFKNSLGSATASGKTATVSSTSTLKTEANVGDTVYGAIIYTTKKQQSGVDCVLPDCHFGMVYLFLGKCLIILQSEYNCIFPVCPLRNTLQYRACFQYNS